MWQQKSGNKYHAKSSIYNGYYYASQLEAAYAQELDLRLKAKDIKAWRRQIPLTLISNGMKVGTYRMDFEITHNDGSIEYVETKGYETPLWQLKWHILESMHQGGDVTLTVVKKRTRYAPSKKM